MLANSDCSAKQCESAAISASQVGGCHCDGSSGAHDHSHDKTSTADSKNQDNTTTESSKKDGGSKTVNDKTDQTNSSADTQAKDQANGNEDNSVTTKSSD